MAPLQGAKDHSFQAGPNGTSCFKEKRLVVERLQQLGTSQRKRETLVNHGMGQLSLEMQTRFKNLRECASFLRWAEGKMVGQWEGEFAVGGPVYAQAYRAHGCVRSTKV